MICNHKVKIQALIDYAKEIGADYVSTGHYAKNILNKKEKEFELREAKDKKKNQVYFLSQLSQSQLKKLKLPLGNYVKEEVYEIAKKQGFKVFRKQKQSQDFCFVANKSYNYLIESELGKKPGKIIDEKGNILGDHQGLYYYTIGQRKGINLPQGPFYVKEKDLKNNRLVVVKDKKELLAKDILVKEIK